MTRHRPRRRISVFSVTRAPSRAGSTRRVPDAIRRVPLASQASSSAFDEVRHLSWSAGGYAQEADGLVRRRANLRSPRRFWPHGYHASAPARVLLVVAEHREDVFWARPNLGGGLEPHHRSWDLGIAGAIHQAQRPGREGAGADQVELERIAERAEEWAAAPSCGGVHNQPVFVDQAGLARHSVSWAWRPALEVICLKTGRRLSASIDLSASTHDPQGAGDMSIIPRRRNRPWNYGLGAVARPV